MSRKGRLIALLLFLSSPQAWPAQGPELKLRENKKEVEDLKKRRHNLEVMESRRLKEKKDLERKIARQRQELRTQSAELKDLKGRESELEFQSRDLDRQLEGSRKQLARRLRSLYEAGLLRPILFLLESSSPAELYGRLAFLDRMATAERALIRKAQKTLDRKNASQKELKLRKADIERNQLRTKKMEKELAANLSAKAEAIREIKKDKKAVTVLIAEYEEENRKITKVIQEVENQRKIQLQGEAGAFLALRRASLGWPVEGKVTRGFGRQELAHNAFLKSEGMEIQAPYGAPVKAVAPGRVIYADWHEGQGRTVILRHGGGDASIYLHLDSLAVSTGQDVVEGQTLGAVGDTGTMSGQAALGFQIRHNAIPQDPALYLRKQ